MRVFFLLIMLALGVAAASGLVFAYDGSNYFFVAVNYHLPNIFVGRISAFPFQVPVLLAAHFTDSLPILKVVFSLAYVSVPILALGGSWLLTRNSSPSLFVWPALGICLAAVPGLADFVSEDEIVVSLSWLLILIFLTDRVRTYRFAALFLATFLFFLHPFSLVFFGFLLVWVVFSHFWDKSVWLNQRGYLPILAILFILRLIWLVFDQEARTYSKYVLHQAFLNGVVGLPLVVQVFAGLAGVACILAAAAMVHGSYRRYLRLFGIVSLSGCCILLAIWSTNSSYWQYAVNYRLFAVFFCLPFMILAAIEVFLSHHSLLIGQPQRWLDRRRLVQLAGCAFMVTIVGQSFSWHGMTARLESTLQDSQQTCLAMSSISWMQNTSLNLWSTPLYAIIIQGRRPAKLVLDEHHCQDTDFSTAIHLTPWTVADRSIGWFDLRTAGMDTRALNKQ